MKKSVIFMGAFALFLGFASCSSEDAVLEENTPVENPVNENPPANENPGDDQDDDDQGDDESNLLYIGDWKIINKREFKADGTLIDDRNHDHRCSTMRDIYRIENTGDAYEYRFNSNCDLSVNEEFTVETVNGKVFLNAESFKYEIIFADGKDLQLKREFDTNGQNDQMAYFIIYLTK